MDVDRDGRLTPQEFINGLLNMRGPAKARRIFELHCQVQHNRYEYGKRIDGVEVSLQRVERTQARQEAKMDQLQASVASVANHLAQIAADLDTSRDRGTELT